MDSATHAQLADALEQLRQEIGRLGERVATLESTMASQARGPAASGDPHAEVMLVIGAAVAAFLGEKARVRQIRLTGGRSWAQQGRATIQASHALSVQHASRP
jgi:methylmalonyl-CoA carboxyltransferase large subunit